MASTFWMDEENFAAEFHPQTIVLEKFIDNTKYSPSKIPFEF